jgi:hypothetical protein
VGLGILAAVLMLGCQWSARAEPFSPYPGLPEVSFPNGGWAFASEVGMSETAKAKQWVRVPALTAASWNGAEPSGVDPEPGVKYRYAVKGDAVFVSPPGYKEGYGHMAPMTVRTVGFGMVPVEATVQVSQRRADGLPIPIHVVLRQDVLYDGDTDANGEWIYYPAHITDAFQVRVTRVLVDGIDIGLTGNCRTARPAPVKIVTPMFRVPKDVGGDVGPWLWANKDPSEFFHPQYGGQLSGTVTIPPFIDCTTRTGDDLSPMVTASVAGPGNHVTFEMALACGRPYQGVNWPPKPGQNTPARSGCPAPNPLPYPARGESGGN